MINVVIAVIMAKIGYVAGAIWVLCIIISFVSQAFRTEQCNHITGKTLIFGIILAILQANIADNTMQEVVALMIMVDIMLLVMLISGVIDKILFQV